MPPLERVEACHVRATCNGCGTTAELCARRELAATALATAAQRFERAGWHHDPGDHTRSRTLEDVERSGRGRWYCPACARRTHL